MSAMSMPAMGHVRLLAIALLATSCGASKAMIATSAAPRYAIANLAILPAEIRGDVNILQQFGQAAVIERRAPSRCDTR